jgi:endonuclease YncB( thermonuclease family)
MSSKSAVESVAAVAIGFLALLFLFAGAMLTARYGPSQSPLQSASCYVDSSVAQVIRVIDGDTYVITGGRRVRVIGIDTPEMHTPFGTLAKQRVARYFDSLGTDVMIYYESDSVDCYGRLLGHVKILGGDAGDLDIGSALLMDGLARPMAILPDTCRARLYRGIFEKWNDPARGIYGSR